MRFRRLPGLLALVALVALAFGLGRTSAQGLVPDGYFVRDSGGTVWLIAGGQRAQVPIYPVGDDVIFQIPDSFLWVVAGEGGALTLGGQPDYTMGGPAAPPAAVMPPAPTPTPVPEDPPPTLSIQLDDDRIQAGQKISITVISDDNEGIEWIEWEGVPADADDNENNDDDDVDDPALQGRHRHDCDGRAQCAFVWEVSPTIGGNYTIRARAQDEEGNRSEWTGTNLRVTGSVPVPTATPTRTP